MKQAQPALQKEVFQLARNIPLRDFHPMSWDDIHAERQRFFDALEAVEKTGDELSSPLRSVGTAFGYRFGYDGLNEVALRSRLAAFWLKVCPVLRYQAEFTKTPPAQAKDKIKVGFFSEFFCDHTVGYFSYDLIKNIDRTRFEVVVFYPANIQKDSVFDDFVATADKAVQVPYAIAGARQAIEQEQPDILFYPEIGMGALTYFLAHARLAYVQCTTWGHPVTTGLPHMDYFLSSKLIETEQAQDHYTEKLVCFDALPTTLSPPPEAQGNKSRADFGLPESGTLYLCPQNMFKIHPEYDGYIKDILEADKDGYFVMNERHAQHKAPELMARFEKNIGPELCKRILFVPRVPEEFFLDFISHADVMLDPIHFGSGRSGYEAIAAGVPLITQPGEFMRARVVVGLYRKIGVEDCIADSRAAYVEKAVSIANDRDKRQNIADRMKAHAGRVFDSESTFREIEQFFSSAYQSIISGSKP